MRETHLVPEGIRDVRLSDYASKIFEPILSRKGVSKAIKRGEVWVNGGRAKSGDWVETGQLLELVDLQQRIPKVYALPLEVVFEDEYLAIINKPPGIEVSGNKFRTVENALSGNKFRTVENALSGSVSPSTLPDALPWPKPVHRLDYSTGGLLLVAKTSGAQRELGNCFEERRIHKHYCAVVMGRIPMPGTVEVPIGGLSARSGYEPVRVVPSLRSGHLTLVDLFPTTGRTHQLRIHMASIGHPIVGDLKYGEAGNILKGKGLFLAAVGLRLPHPVTRQEMNVTLDTPPKFIALLKREQDRWDTFN